MGIPQLLLRYIFWHYSNALVNFVRIWENFLWFFYHFFSIPTLTKTLFSPFRRLGEEYSGGFHLQELATVVVVNTMMRLIGAVARTIVIAIGIGFLFLTAVGGVIVGIAWIVMPIVLGGLFLIGTGILF